MTEQKNTELGTEAVLWNLADLYTGIDDPAIDIDLNWCDSEAGNLQKQYSGRVNVLSEEAFLDLVTRLEQLETRLTKIATFASLNFATRTKDAAVAAFLQKIREQNSQINKKTIFFELEWGKTAEGFAEKIINSPLLATYAHYLKNLRRYAPHLLSHAEETLLLEIAPVGRGSWNNLFDKVMGHLKFGTSGRTEEEVLADLYRADRETRGQAARELTEGLESQLHVLTHIFNTLLADKMISDRLRSYPAWVSSMNLYNELENETVQVLIEAVTSRYDIPARYYRLKRDLIGLPELLDYDRYAPLPHLPDAEITWDESRDMVLAAFAAFSPDMAEIAGYFYDRSWIHAPLMEGKRGGAFAHPCIPEIHPYIMVNYTGNLRDVSTVAHELGHGVHQYLAAERGYYNSGTPLVLAETASVFAELLLFTHQLDLLKDTRGKKAFVCQKLESIFATVFRQVAMNRFEDLAHNARRSKGELPREEISRLWLQTQQAMFGDSVTLTDNYSIWWSYIPHFLNSPGYVYSYAFGELLVLSLYKIYQQEGELFIPKYIQLLQAGGSSSPYDLVSRFGVDLNDPGFWQGGLALIDELLKTVE